MNPIATAVVESPASGHADADRETDARFQFQQAVAKQAQLEQLLKQGRAILLELRSRFDQVCAQRDQVAAELDELKNEHQGCASVHQQFQSEQAQLRTSLDESHALAQRLKDEQIDALRVERAALTAERETQSVQLIERDTQLAERDSQLAERNSQLAERNSQLAERDTHLAERDTRVREYDAAHEQMIDERAQLEERMTAIAADHRQEVNAMEQTIKRLEPLAEAGRLAREVGEELRSAAADIDARAGHLLADLEQLRSDAVRAGSLGRRLVERDQSRVEE